MKRAFRTWSALLLLAVVLASGCSSGRKDSEATTQADFGVRMARMNLWREALFRFQRAVDMNPADAQARNNLAVAYEANGDFENALKHYREAIRLDKSNQHIQKNYSRFVEFTSRNRKRQQRPAVAGAAPATATATTEGTPAAAPSNTPAAAPAVAEPAAAPSAPAADGVPGSVTSPIPAAAAPAATPPPNPQPEPAGTTPPPPQPPSQGVFS